MSGNAFSYPLTIGLPHTNYNQLAEFLFLMQAGHLQWTSISRMLGVPLSSLRTVDGSEVYATYLYIEEEFPPGQPMSGFRLDDSCVFLNVLRSFKNISVDGRMLFARAAELPDEAEAAFAADPDSFRGRFPWMRLANIFITPAGGNEFLKIAPPANVSFGAFPALPNRENAFHIVRAAEKGAGFSTVGDDFSPADREPGFAVRYAINPDRDTNGAGLVYFANYVAFMDYAERRAMAENAAKPFTADEIARRTLGRREIVYYGNVAVTDTLRIRVSMFRRGAAEAAFRYRIERESDGRLIALSEAVKRLSG